MSRFHNILKKDLKNIMLNVNEFAEEIKVNGVTIKASVQKNINSELESESTNKKKRVGTQNGFVIYTSQEEINKLPKKDRRIYFGLSLNIDGELHTVISSKVDMGLIKLETEVTDIGTSETNENFVGNPWL